MLLVHYLHSNFSNLAKIDEEINFCLKNLCSRFAPYLLPNLCRNTKNSTNSEVENSIKNIDIEHGAKTSEIISNEDTLPNTISKKDKATSDIYIDSYEEKLTKHYDKPLNSTTPSPFDKSKETLTDPVTPPEKNDRSAMFLCSIKHQNENSFSFYHISKKKPRLIDKNTKNTVQNINHLLVLQTNERNESCSANHFAPSSSSSLNFSAKTDNRLKPCKIIEMHYKPLGPQDNLHFILCRKPPDPQDNHLGHSIKNEHYLSHDFRTRKNFRSTDKNDRDTYQLLVDYIPTSTHTHKFDPFQHSKNSTKMPHKSDKDLSVPTTLPIQLTTNNFLSLLSANQRTTNFTFLHRLELLDFDRGPSLYANNSFSSFRNNSKQNLQFFFFQVFS